MSEVNKVILEIVEKEETKLSGKGIQENIDITGNFSVINPSKTNRIWNAVRVIKGIETTNIADVEEKIGEIKPEGKNIISYKIQEQDVSYKPLIELTEIIDTYFEKGDETNWNFVLNKRSPTKFVLKLKNNSKEPTSKVNLKKIIPEVYDSPVIESTSSGNANYDESSRTVHWTDVSIAPGGEQILSFRAGANPLTTEPSSAGAIDVDYQIENVQRSKLVPSLQSVAESIFALEKSESMDKQGEWECTVEFENTSDFEVTLNQVMVQHKKETTLETILEENPSVVLPPKHNWSKDFLVKSSSPPKFTKTNKFKVDTQIVKRVIGHISKTADIIPVSAIDARKIVTPQEINAHAKTDINVEILIKNSGSSPLSAINIIDTIPNGFKPPSLDQIDVFIRSSKVSQGVLLELEPNNDDPKMQHQLTIEIPDITKNTSVLAPNDDFIVRYPLIAWDPSPNNYPCPLEANFNVKPPGPPVKSTIPDLKFIAKQVRRRYRAFKQVRPGGEEGEFVINVVFQNKGEVPVQKCKIAEKIPQNFVLVNWSPEEIKPESTDIDEGTKITWNLTNVGAGAEVTLTYTIKGTGDYEEEDPEVEF
ncbi:MAG: hypothetical protein EAX96_16395 [Candidatus Lokiarchaeota archaeon]|nr:hypothetical protein [Candidatus Lokiarchaeota archaeon]